MEHIYLAIDLKSFYASVECAELGADPLKLNLVVADDTRSDKTICLAVSPSLKKLGVPGRPRLFEAKQAVKKVNEKRLRLNQYQPFTGCAYFDEENENIHNEVRFVTAKPRMQLYIDYSTRIYHIYLQYFAPEDIHVYSIDEVFIDATAYLKTYKKTAEDLATQIVQDIVRETHITATVGIGTNLFLAKVAMDIIAKHAIANRDGIRIGYLDEITFRKTLWTHTPLTDFWRIGSGTTRRLATLGLYTMGDIARYSLQNEDDLYQLFGVNAELLIDHAWGVETTTIQHIKAYEPEVHSLQTGQVLPWAYTYEEAKMVIKEMVDQLVLDMCEKRVMTNRISLYVCYDNDNIANHPEYDGPIVKDGYGRLRPKDVHGGIRFEKYTNSHQILTQSVLEIYQNIVHKQFMVRRIFIGVDDIQDESIFERQHQFKQLNLFCETSLEEDKQYIQEIQKERNLQQTINTIRSRFGKNACIKLMNLQHNARQIERNEQIGGHSA